MSESIITGILEDIYSKEFEDLDKLPNVKTSFRHKLAMKRIFSDFEKNTSSNAEFHCNKHISLKRKMILIIAFIICAVMLTGAVIVYFSRNFNGTVYSDNTQLFAVNTDNCPRTIENEYRLSELPYGFEETVYNSSPFSVSRIFENTSTGQTILFNQWAKPAFDSRHYNTENQKLSEIEINGHYGLFLDTSTDEVNSFGVIWDNGDYILEISGNISKPDLLDLAKSTKVV